MKEIALDKLMKDIDCFDATKEDFIRLKNITFNDLETMNDDACRITPLLEQISKYALADMLANDYITAYLDENINPKAKLKAVKVMKLCSTYIEELARLECSHPAIVIYNSILDGTNLYNTIMDLIVETHEYLRPEIKEYFVSFLDEVDESIISTIDNVSYDTVETIEKTDKPKEILKFMSNFAQIRGLYLSLMNTNFLAITDGTNFIKTFKDNKAEYTLKLSEIIKTVNELSEEYYETYYKDEDFYEEDDYDENFDEFGYDEEDYDEYNAAEYNEDAMRNIIYSNLLNILGAYTEYKKCQFEYLKNQVKETKILEYCKKDVK